MSCKYMHYWTVKLRVSSDFSIDMAVIVHMYSHLMFHSPVCSTGRHDEARDGERASSHRQGGEVSLHDGEDTLFSR